MMPSLDNDAAPRGASTGKQRSSAVGARLERLRNKMAEQGMEAFVLFVLERANSESCRYISGFSGSSAALIISADGAVLVTDGRYRTQAARESPLFSLVVQSDVTLGAYAAKAVAEAGWKTVGAEFDKISHRMFEVTLAPGTQGVKWLDASALIPAMRRTKDASEVSAIRAAGVIAREAYGRALRQVHAGMAETEFEMLLLSEIKALGGEKGWAHDDFVVASGKRGAMCHARATSAKFAEGDIVTVDYGAMFRGYMSDITRNFSLGRPDDKAKRINEVLLKAHLAGAAMLRPGVPCRDVDAAVRKVIADAGFGEYFVHGLGHGLGLEVHEAPRLSSKSKDTLQIGDVVTVEPGIYIEGWGGMRIEDDYLITQSGSECLTPTDNRSLEIIKS